MFNLMFIFIIIIFITIIILKMSIFISFKNKINMEKMIPFECGFDPISSSRAPFSLQFFMISIIFLIFDVELTLLIPMVKTFFFSKMISWLYTSFILIFILLVGIYFEWMQGALEWQ